MPCLSRAIRRRDGRVQGDQARRVRSRSVCSLDGADSPRLKRLQAAKKIRDKRRKDDALTVKNMANIRVRQRAQVHVQGMTTKIANEDVRPLSLFCTGSADVTSR